MSLVMLSNRIPTGPSNNKLILVNVCIIQKENITTYGEL
jgi:hypothetical protein